MRGPLPEVMGVEGDTFVVNAAMAERGCKEMGGHLEKLAGSEKFAWAGRAGGF